MAIKWNELKKCWTVSYSKRPGKNLAPVSRKRTGLKSEREAKAAYNELILEVEKKIEAKVVPSWKAIFEAFIRDCEFQNYSKKTIHSYVACLNAHTMKDWGHRPVTTITRAEILTRLKESVGHRTQGHQKYILKNIRHVFQFAIESGHLTLNPVPHMKFKLGDKIKQVLTEPQVRSFLNKAKELDDDWYPHWVTAIYTGMRSGELYALTWDKVDLDTRKIIVDCAWDNQNGFKDQTKSGDDRVIEIAPSLLPLFTELKLKSGGEHFVLPRLEKWDRGEQARELQRFLLGMGLPGIRFHDLRATWATLLLGKGVPPINVMKMGGWKNIETMMIYARKAGVDIRGSTDCLKLHDPVKRFAEVHSLPVRS